MTTEEEKASADQHTGVPNSEHPPVTTAPATDNPSAADPSNPKQPRGRPAAVQPGAIRVVGDDNNVVANSNTNVERTITSPGNGTDPNGGVEAMSGMDRPLAECTLTHPPSDTVDIDTDDNNLPQTTTVTTAEITPATEDAMEGGLIQADLVQREPSAKLVEGVVLTNKGRRKLFFLGGAVILAIVLAAILGVVLSGDRRKSSPAVAPTRSMSPTLSPTVSPPGAPFVTTEELYEAVDEYLLNPTRTSNVSMLYGYPIGRWNVSGISDMTALFDARRKNDVVAFNQPISDWDVSGVTSMEAMLRGAVAFNQPLEGWDVSSVENMDSMLRDAVNFNQPLEKWNVSQVISMRYMFDSARTFNQPLNSWDVAKVTNMMFLFSGCSEFDQPLNSWDVSSVTDMEEMFSNTAKFNGPITDWNTSSVRSMFSQFWLAESFDQPLAGWETSRVTNMAYMFTMASSFNQPIGGWDVSQVVDLSHMFDRAPAFNQPLEGWDVSGATDMSRMFTQAIAFNQDVSKWNLTSMTHAVSLFAGASKFNQDLCGWAPDFNASESRIGAMFIGTNCTFQDTPDVSADPIGPFCSNTCGYSPAPPSNNGTEAVWEVIEPGNCALDGSCIASQAIGKSSYGSYEACTFAVKSAGTLKVEVFGTEEDWDVVLVLDPEGTMESFSGALPPAGLVNRNLEAGTRITFTSDYNIQAEGWRFCIEPNSS